MSKKSGENPDFKSWNEFVDPDRAKALLQQNHELQRHHSVSVVKRYAATMRSGSWLMSPQPIVINSAGKMVDGQHRMLAVVESNTSQWFSFVQVPDDKYITTIDRGHGRAHGHILEMSGSVKKGFGKRYSSVMRSLLSLETDIVRNMDFESLAPSILDNCRSEISDVLHMVKGSNTVPAAILAAIVYAYPCDRSLVADLIAKVNDNDGLEKGSGAWHMRKLMDEKTTKDWSDSLELAKRSLRALHLAFEKKKLITIYRKTDGEHQSVAFFRKLRNNKRIGGIV